MVAAHIQPRHAARLIVQLVIMVGTSPMWKMRQGLCPQVVWLTLGDLGEMAYLPVFPLLYLPNGENNRIYLTGLFPGVNELTRAKRLEQRLAPESPNLSSSYCCTYVTSLLRQWEGGGGGGGRVVLTGGH